MNRKLLAALLCLAMLMTAATLKIFAVNNAGRPENPAKQLREGALRPMANAVQEFTETIEINGGNYNSYNANTVTRIVVNKYFDNLVYVSAVGDGTITYEVSGGELSVKGYTFADDTHLTVKFKVSPKTGFLGGNAVPVCDEKASGFYKDGTRADGLPGLDELKKDVAVPAIEVDALNKNVCYKVPVSKEDLISSAAARAAGDNVDILAELAEGEKWRAEFVDISSELLAGDAAFPQGFETDIVYNLNVKVTPKGDNSIRAGGGMNSVNIFVYKPVVKFRDLQCYYGAEADLKAAYVSPTEQKKQEWKHGNETLSDTTDFAGTVPKIDADGFTFEKADGTELKDYIDKPADYYIKVTAGKYQSYDTELDADDMVFVHETCTFESCPFVSDKGEFMIHVKTCELTVKKAFASGEKPHQGVGESFIVDVTGDNDNKIPVSIRVTAPINANGEGSVVIKGLPVGKYTAAEDGKWSWRYNAQSGDDVTLSGDNPSGEITVTNTPEKPKWLTWDDYLGCRLGSN